MLRLVSGLYLVITASCCSILWFPAHIPVCLVSLCLVHISQSRSQCFILIHQPHAYDVQFCFPCLMCSHVAADLLVFATMASPHLTCLFAGRKRNLPPLHPQFPLVPSSRRNRHSQHRQSLQLHLGLTSEQPNAPPGELEEPFLLCFLRAREN